jgi:hypothetical protein
MPSNYQAKGDLLSYVRAVGGMCKMLLFLPSVAVVHPPHHGATTRGNGGIDSLAPRTHLDTG